jgi:hypothetical protein
MKKSVWYSVRSRRFVDINTYQRVENLIWFNTGRIECMHQWYQLCMLETKAVGHIKLAAVTHSRGQPIYPCIAASSIIQQ